MNAEAKVGPTIKGVSVHAMPATAVAREFFRDGEGQDSNPYERGTPEHEAFMWEMHNLWHSEFIKEQDELRGRV